jgi:hypothetical protein
LSYANYLVLPRTILQSMPMEWQHRFVELLWECQSACDQAGIETPEYRVHLVRNGRYVRETLPHYRRAPNVLLRPLADDRSPTLEAKVVVERPKTLL